MKGVTTCLETLSLYRSALTFPFGKNVLMKSWLPTSVYYNDKLHGDKIPHTDIFFQVATYSSVCSNLPQCEESLNILS